MILAPDGLPIAGPVPPEDPAPAPRVWAPNNPWLAQLRFEDLQRLRRIVRAVHMRHYPQALMTDHEADRIIEAFGPEVGEQLVKTAIDSFGLD